MLRVTAEDYFFFFFNDTATTEIYTLSLHDALPISLECDRPDVPDAAPDVPDPIHRAMEQHRPHCRTHSIDRKSTRLNSSHLVISYAVFCLKKKSYNFMLIIPCIQCATILHYK